MKVHMLPLFLILVVVAALVALAAIPVQAAGIPLPVGADVSVITFVPVHAQADVETRLALTLRPFPKSRRVLSPTSFGEIVPWLKSNLGVAIPFEGNAQTLLRPSGLGATEQAKFGSIGPSTVTAGVGWLSGSGLCWMFAPVNLPL